MRFGDDGAIDVRLDLRDVAISIVDPDLHEAHAARAQLPDVIASLCFGSRAVRNAQAGLAGRTSDRRCGDPLPHGEEARGIRDHLVTQLVRQFLIGLEPHAQRGRDAVVRVPLQLVDEVVAPVVRLAVAPVLFVDQPDVVVTVDERGHHGLAGEIHANGALRRLTLTLLADPREGVTLHEERGILDRRAAIPDDEPRTFEPDGGAGSALGARVQRRRASATSRAHVRIRASDITIDCLRIVPERASLPGLPVELHRDEIVAVRHPHLREASSRPATSVSLMTSLRNST